VSAASVAIVIPARNEAPRVASVVACVRTVLPSARVLVVENGSTDDTERQAARAGAEVLRAPAGYARALGVGLAHACAGGASRIVQLDADGQHPAEALPSLLGALDGADLVVGSRFVGDDPGYPVPLARRVAIRALSCWAGLCAGQRVLDVTSGLRAWRADALARVLPGWPEDVADANVLVRAVRLGLRVEEIPVRMRARAGGTSQHAGAGALAFCARMAWLSGREALR
jgi:glycosyltransferase involved in cell wall biosynthesis